MSHEIHLYHCPGTRSDRVKLLLNMLELPYTETLIDQAAGGHKNPQYLKINPFGKLPGLTLDGQLVVESAAQMLLIADIDPEHRMAPRPGVPARAAYVQWLVATPTSIEPMVMPALSRMPIPGAKKNFKKALEIQTALYQGPYLAGPKLTAADIFLHWGLRFVHRLGLLDQDPLWLDYAERLNAELDWQGLNAPQTAEAAQ